MKKKTIISFTILLLLLTGFIANSVYSKYIEVQSIPPVHTVKNSQLYDMKKAELKATSASDEDKLKNHIEENKNDSTNITSQKEPTSKKVEANKNNSNEKIAYLTFDDGPTTNVTPQILDTLKKYNIKGTFFVLGSMCEKNPELLKRLQEEGHYIANHSYSHKYKYIYSSPANFLSDVKRCEDVISSILGPDFKPSLVRFPGGSFSKKMDPYKQALKNLHYEYVDWNALNGDAEKIHVPTNTLINNVKKTTANKKHVVILMHDSSTKQTTATALPQIIEYLKSKGYKFETLINYKN